MEKHGIRLLSPFQTAAGEVILADRDCLIDSPTGTGKTLLYLLPLLSRLEPQGSGRRKTKILIICPTRELSLQTAEVVRGLLETTEGIRTAVLCGGTDMNSQIRAFHNGADIVIGTPSRLCSHLRRHTLKTDAVSCTVIDEADMLAEKGFMSDMSVLLAAAEGSQKILCAATDPDAAMDAFGKYLNDPAVLVNHEKKPADRLKVFHVIVREDRKITALVRILRNENTQAVVFTRKRSTASFVSEKLNGSGFRSAAVRSDSDYRQRRETMKQFRAGRLDVLCTTDLFSRGMDVPLDVVIFYDPADNESILIHRTGRTARFSASGRVIHILTPDQKHVLKTIEKTASVRSCPYGSQ
ncbi:MAG: DEAD/DEAH box helicase [Solobacterium sp.]|nr:DEAD/DEAH box helicase [Solobacterium sp.]